MSAKLFPVRTGGVRTVKAIGAVKSVRRHTGMAAMKLGVTAGRTLGGIKFFADNIFGTSGVLHKVRNQLPGFHAVFDIFQFNVAVMIHQRIQDNGAGTKDALGKTAAQCDVRNPVEQCLIVNL